MTENQAMSDERLEDLRRDVMSQVASAGGRTRHSDAYAEMLDEIDRLRAENERLRQAGIAALEYMDECECYWPDGSPDQGYIPISRPCPHALVQRALNPEPTS